MFNSITSLPLLEEKSHPLTLPGINVRIYTVHESKQNFNSDHSSRLHIHSIQPTGSKLFTTLHTMYALFNSITPSRLVEEKSHPSTLQGINFWAFTVHESKQNYNSDHSSRLHIVSNLLEGNYLLLFILSMKCFILLISYG